ncbi:YadA-like family protein, partial [Neisseria sp. HMSC075C10]|uniref:YadA family autotransporter adhesin n=1 Tax=Neisseria sp. HMSC075C10 TaxID=1739539 RepID=UPI000AC6E34D
TDGEGNTTTTIVKDGTAAAKGDTGDNGKSAEAEVTRDDAKGETTITVRNLDKDGKVIGTTSEVVKDGKNAEAKVETTAKGEHTVTIKDGNGNTTTTIIRDGKDGKDGKDADGTFGLRDEDNAEITKKLNNTIQIKGDKGTVQVFDKATGKTSEKEVQNIFVKEDGGALKVSLNRDLHVDSVTSNSVTTNELNVGPVTINQGGIDAGNTTIQNVAPGKKGTDAVNVNQLNQKIGDVNSNVNKVDNNARAGVAQALATAGLPQAYLPGKSMLAIGGGHYRGETGYAVGFSSISDGGNWIIKGTASGNSRGHFGATAAVGYQW